MAKEPISLIDDALPSQGMPLGGSQEEIEVEEIEEPTDMMEEEDGSVVLNFEEMVTEELQAEQDANLAEIMDERVLMDISSELVGYYEDDKSGRQEWEDTYTDGLDLLGVKYERIIPLLLEGIKEQQDIIEQLEVRIKKLEDKNAD